MHFYPLCATDVHLDKSFMLKVLDPSMISNELEDMITHSFLVCLLME